MLLFYIHAVNHDSSILGKNLKNFSFFPPVVSRNNFYFVAFFESHDMHQRITNLLRIYELFIDRIRLFVPDSLFVDYTTSSASEIIFENPRSRSSLGTGPKMRPPFGSTPSTMIAALSSKRMYDPSARRKGARVLVTTARTTSFFFTCLRGSADFTDATTISPRRA